MRLALCLFALATAAYSDEHDSREAIHGEVGDARYQSNHKGEDEYRPETDMEDSITMHPTSQPTDGFQGHKDAVETDDTITTFAPTVKPTNFPTKKPTMMPTKDQGGCEYTIRVKWGSSKKKTVIKPVGWAGPGQLNKYCNKWSCVRNTRGAGGKWVKAGMNRDCALKKQNGETKCVHTKCNFNLKSRKQGGFDKDRIAKSISTQKRNSIYNEIGGVGIMQVAHDHRETKKNHRCRHNLDARQCDCFCHGDVRRQDEVGFRRAIHEINRDYAGLADYAQHRTTQSAGRNAFAGSSHTRADEAANFKGDKQGEYWNDQQTGTLLHPHYQGDGHFAGNQ
jgi:hypothetical protein